jgi:electron transfer flavoprotein alpha subunit
MSVLVFAENIDGKFHKPVLEALTYASDLAKNLQTQVAAVVAGPASADELGKLGRYGAGSILHAADERLKNFNILAFTKVLEDAVKKSGADVIIMSSTFDGKALAARLSARLKAGLVTNVLELPETGDGFVVKKSVYSGKGFGNFRINTPVKILTIGINSYKIAENPQQPQTESLNPAFSDADFSVKSVEIKREKGTISLPEAEVVVSGGRGMKGPENWHLIEELAEILGAATACSKPVADVHWRPHAEHVGQTGLAISPNLYIAIGISGAIQHLAGVSGSKVIAVINKDPEAPFFKAADYGIVGDAFEVLPKLIEAARQIKSA